MRVRRYEDARSLLSDCAAFLLQREAENNLILGLLAGVAARTVAMDGPPYLAAVLAGEGAVLVGLMTPPHNLVLSHCALSDALRLLAEDALKFSPVPPGVLARKETARDFCAIWRDLTGTGAHRSMAERIYELTAVGTVRGVAGAMRAACPNDRELLVRWTTAFMEEAGTVVGDARLAAQRSVESRLAAGPDAGICLWEDKGPVSLAGFSGPTATGIRVGPVYTPPSLRRHGYASALVAALSKMLLSAGRERCFLYTDLANPTSNKIYQEIGYVPVCDADQYAFGDEA